MDLLGCGKQRPHHDPSSMQANFTNEGGYEYRYRYLKNIMGLWMIQSVRRELGEHDRNPPVFPGIDCRRAGSQQLCRDRIHWRRPLLAPKSMIKEVKAACIDGGKPVPATTGEVMQTIYNFAFA